MDRMRSGKGFERSDLTVIAGAVAVAAVALVTYYPATRIGFVNNDWIYMDRLARLTLPEYLAQYWVPGVETGWYRPLFGMLFLLIYSVFGSGPAPFHLAYVALHALNGVLFLAVTARLAHRWRMAAVAALVYVGLPMYSKAVYWPSTPDTLAMLFCLAAIWFWADHLETGRQRSAVITLALFVLALLSKEASVTLPAILFLIDLLLVPGFDHRPNDSIPSSSGRAVLPAVGKVLLRYAPFVVVLVPYLAIEYALQRSGSYVSLAGYGIGPHMLANLAHSFAALAFPWRMQPPWDIVWLVVVAAAFAAVMLLTRSRALLFLAGAALIPLLPVMGFPTAWFELRYLYGAGMVPALVLAALLERGRARWGGSSVYPGVAALVIAGVLFANAAGVGEAVAGWGEIARQRSVPFRDLVRAHPALQEPARFFLIEPQSVSVYDLSVMFLLRYGQGVSVDGLDDNQTDRTARLQSSPNPFVYYFDDTQRPVRLEVRRSVAASPSVDLPADWGDGAVRLLGYEMTTDAVQRGEAFGLFLYWSATRPAGRDYAIAVRLVDGDGHVAAASEGPPRRGKMPTGEWRPGALVTDARILVVASDAPPGAGYWIQVGLLAPDSQPVPVLDGSGRPLGETIAIGPVTIQ